MSSTDPQPAESALWTDVRALLDDALVAVRAIAVPDVAREAVEDRLSLALRHVYCARAGGAEWAVVRRETESARQFTREALEALQQFATDDAGTQDATRLAAQALGRLGAIRIDPDDEAQLPTPGVRKALVTASLGVPRLLDPPRSVLRPAMPLDELPSSAPPPPVEQVEVDRPLTLGELEALAERAEIRLEAFARAQDEAKPEPAPSRPPPRIADESELDRQRFGVALSDVELRFERARECLEDLAMLGCMRRPQPDEAWASGARSEARMLTKLDALVASGDDVWPGLVHLLDDRPMPDPELTFAIVFMLCSVAGDDTFEQAVRLLRISDLGDPDMFVMLTDALVFGPHPRIDRFMPRWLRADEAERRALATEVLRRRGTLLPAHVEAIAADPEPRVLASLARALPQLGDRVPRQLLDTLLGHDDEQVVRGALEAAAWMRAESGYRRAVELVRKERGSFAEAAMFVAISGRPDARPVLEDEIASEGYPTALRALGWYGDATFFPFLIGRVRNGSPEAQSAALDALERMSGASLDEAGTLPSYAPGAEPFVRAFSEYEPPQSAPCVDADAWDAWWKAYGPQVTAKQRYRWGSVYSARHALRELGQDPFLHRDRLYVALELVVRGQRKLQLDCSAWIHAQRAVLAELGPQ